MERSTKTCVLEVKRLPAWTLCRIPKALGYWLKGAQHEYIWIVKGLGYQYPSSEGPPAAATTEIWQFSPLQSQMQFSRRPLEGWGNGAGGLAPSLLRVRCATGSCTRRLVRNRSQSSPACSVSGPEKLCWQARIFLGWRRRLKETRALLEKRTNTCDFLSYVIF